LTKINRLYPTPTGLPRYKEAIDLYTRGLQIDPDNHVLYSNRSAAYLKENERGQVRLSKAWGHGWYDAMWTTGCSF